MPTPSPTPTAGPPDRGPESDPRLLAVCRSVMDALGSPADLLRVTARRVADGAYRVNVVTGADLTRARVAHSFYVTADAAGVVTGSSPAIRRLN